MKRKKRSTGMSKTDRERLRFIERSWAKADRQKEKLASDAGKKLEALLGAHPKIVLEIKRLLPPTEWGLVEPVLAAAKHVMRHPDVLALLEKK